MAAPVVQGRASAVQSTGVTSHSVTLPTSVAVGELLVVFFGGFDGSSSITTSTSGWNQQSVRFQGSAGTGVGSTIFYKIATGSDALTVTTSLAVQSSHISFRISGASSNILTASVVLAATTTPDPPNLSGGVSDDYLWIAARHGENIDVPASAPTNYGNLTNRAGSGASGVSSTTAERTLTASAENPGAFTTTSRQAVAWTIAICPSLVAGAAKRGCPVFQCGTIGANPSAVYTTMTAPVPPGAATGDVMLAMLYCDPVGATVTPPTGFTEAPNSPISLAGSHDMHVYWKRLTGADTGSYSFSIASGAGASCAIARFTNVIASGTPFDTLTTAAAAKNGTASTTAPGVSGTPAGAGRELILANVDFNAADWTPPAGWPLINNDSFGNSWAHKAAPSAVASGSLAGTFTVSGAITAWLGALIGADAAAPGEFFMAA